MADTPYHRLYNTKVWSRLRQAILARDLYTCQRCGVILTSGRQHPRAAVVNHITPHKGDLGLFHDPDNLEAVCKQCHDGDIMAEERGRTIKTQIGPDGWPVH